MADEVKSDSGENQGPLISPTGKPLVSPKLVPYFFAAFMLCLSITTAAAAEALPKPVLVWAGIGTAFFGGMLGITPGLRGKAPMLLLVLGLGFSSCATVDPIIVAGQSLKVAKAEYHATVQLMDQALASGLVTPEQFHEWRQFSDYFEVAFEHAVELWDLASAAVDENTKLGAGAIADGLYKQLQAHSLPKLKGSP